MSRIPPDGNEEISANDNLCPTLRDQTIRSDGLGRVCLNDLWAIAGSDHSRRPGEWKRSKAAKRLERALGRRIMEISHISEAPQLIHSTRGTKGLTFAHLVLAQVYAEYLDDALAVEVREVFLRYRAADASLADDILERASVEDNRHAAARALGRVTRFQFTDVLQGHGVRQPWYAICTNAVYRTVLGKVAADLKAERGLKKADSLRDAMSTTELAAIALAESFSADRIAAKSSHGGPACNQETAAASRTVRAALDAEARARSAKLSPPANDPGPSKAA